MTDTLSGSRPTEEELISNALEMQLLKPKPQSASREGILQFELDGFFTVQSETSLVVAVEGSRRTGPQRLDRLRDRRLLVGLSRASTATTGDWITLLPV